MMLIFDPVTEDLTRLMKTDTSSSFQFNLRQGDQVDGADEETETTDEDGTA